MSAVQDQFAALTQQSQDVVSGALRTWAESVERLTSAAGKAGNAGGTDLPAGALDPTAMVEAAFDVAERVLATQRELTLALVRTMTSGLPGTER